MNNKMNEKFSLLMFNPQFQNGFELIELIENVQQQIFEFLLCRPINFEDGLIYTKMSTQRKEHQNQQIILYNHFIVSICEQKGLLTNEDKKYFLEDEEIEDINKKNLEISQLLQRLENYPQEIEILLRDQLSQNYYECKQITDHSITFCLLYTQQTFNELCQYLKHFVRNLTIQNQNIVILVNGWEYLDDTLKSQFKIKKISSNLKCNTCFCFDFELDQEDIQLIILNEKQKDINLLKWIYNGVAKHYQTQYFFIGQLDLELDSQQFQKAHQILLQNKQFGVLLYDKIVSQFKDNCDLFQLNVCLAQQINNLNNEFIIDSLTTIKKYHQPFLCYYNWNFIRDHINEYLEKLSNELQKNKINLYLNYILPQLIYKNTKKEAYSLCNPVGQRIIKQSDFQNLYLFDVLQKKQHYQAQCNKAALKQGFIFKKLLYFIKYIERNFNFSIILFIFIISPYQLFYINTEYLLIRTLVSIIIPLILIISIFFYILLPQQYQIGLKFIQKSLTTMNAQLQQRSFLKIYLSQDEDIIPINNINELKTNIKSKNQSNIQYNLTNVFNYLQTQNIQIQEQNQLINQNQIMITNVRNYSENQNQRLDTYDDVTEKTQNDEYYSFQSQVIIIKSISDTYQIIFYITQIITLFSSGYVIVNIIITFILNKGQEVITLINLFGVLALITFYIIRNLCHNSTILKISLFQYFREIYVIFLQLFVNLLIISVYSEIYHILVVSQNYHNYRKDIRKLISFVYQNFLLTLILIMIETQTNFQGYVYLPIIYYYIVMFIFDSILTFFARLKQIKIQQNANVFPVYNINNYEIKFYEQYKDIVITYINDLNQQKQQVEQQEMKEKKLDYQQIVEQYNLQYHLIDDYIVNDNAQLKLNQQNINDDFND